MDALIRKSMEFDSVDFNDLEEGKEYLVAIESDNSFIIAQCLRLDKVEDDVYHTFFFGDQIRDGVIIHSGGFTINPDERIKIYNWPPAIDGTGGTGAPRKSRKNKRKNRKSRKNRNSRL